MAQHKISDPRDARKLGVVDLPTLQKFVNLWSEQLAYTSRKRR